MIPDLIAQYVDTGKARFVHREFPLNSIHPLAQKASEAAVCAGKQDRYWEMNEHLFANQDEWSQAGDAIGTFKTYAKELGLDTKAFEQCLDSGEAAVVVQGDLMIGEELGVNATPYFFINGLPIRGGLPVEAMGRIIDYLAAGGPIPEIVPTGDDWHVLGSRQTAPAITVAFVDYSDPESGEHAREVFPQLVETYINEGGLLYVLHPWAKVDDRPSTQAAIAAECAGEQGRYWEMHDQLFDDQETWTQAAEPRPLFVGYAESLDLDTEQFDTCLDSEWAALRVEAGGIVGTLYGIPDGPVFLFNNGSAQQGSPTFEQFKEVIDAIINR